MVRKANGPVNTDLERKNELPFAPPGRALDLEYAQPAATGAESRGIEARCEHCGHSVFLGFDVSLQAWETLVSLIAAVADVSRRDLLTTGGRRPSTKIYQGRALLAQALFKVAGEEIGTQWLRILGWSPRRIHSFAEAELQSEEQHYLLEGLRPTMLVDTASMQEKQNQTA